MAADEASSGPGRPLAVVIVGYDDLAAQTVQALRAASDLSLSAVLEDDPGRRARAQALGLPVPTRSTVPCDVLVIREGEESLVALPKAEVAANAAAAGCVGRAGGERIPSADCLAVRRILDAIPASCEAERVYVLILEHSQRVDCLTPSVGAANDTRGWLVQGAPTLVVQRVAVPYDRSNLHVVKIDTRMASRREDVLSALRSAPRLHVGRAADGFVHTAALQEWRRDGGHSDADGGDVFVWSESVGVTGNQVVLMADVCPHATPVHETLDAVRRLGRRSR